jgi:transcriptional regulator with XRE-family HTH domain
MSSGKIDFGEYLLELRTKAGFSQKKVSDKLGIDISLLSKIEHGERQIQGHMLKGISELFNLEYKELQISYLNNKIELEYGKLPFIEEALSFFLSNRSKEVKTNKTNLYNR